MNSKLLICRAAIMGVVLLISSACSDALSPDSDNGAPLPGQIVLTALSPVTGTGTVGESVEVPTVLVQNASGTPLVNITVSFTQIEGRGTIVGGTVLTNSEGIARPTGWYLSSRPGPNTVKAVAGTGQPVVFRRTALPGAPERILKLSSDFLVGTPGGTITPQVVVMDALNNPVPDVSVTFSLSGGDGSVVTTTAVTDTLGTANGSWILGSPGIQKLVATVNADISAVFTAFAIAPNECTGYTLEINDTSYGRLSQSQCIGPDGRPFVSFPVFLPAGSYSFSAVSFDFNTEIELRDTSMKLVAGNDDAPGGGTHSAFGIFTTQSPYYLIVKSHTAAVGDFALQLQGFFSGFGRCSDTFVTRGVAIAQQLSSADCKRSDFEIEKRFKIYLNAGESITYDIDDLSYSGVLGEITDAAGKRLSSEPGSSHLTFTAPADGFYVIVTYGQFEEENSFRLRIQ